VTAASAIPTDDFELVRLRRQLGDAWSEIKGLRRTVAHQARQLSLLEPETHPAAPSVNAVYWLFSLAHEHERSWRKHWVRLLPTLRGVGTLPAPELTPIAWTRHLAQRRHETDRYGGTPCDHTMNIELGRAKGLLDWAVTNQMIAFNPLRQAKYLKTISGRDTKLKAIDVDALLAEAGELRDKRREDYDDDGSRAAMLKAAILVWFDSMLRYNEGRNLRRDLIEPNGDYPVARQDTKTDAGARTVSLTPRTLKAIRAVPAHPATQSVFVNMSTGRLLSEATLRRWFRWACERAHLDSRASPRDGRIVPHHLRHAGATAADAAGARPGALQVTLGHASIRATERYLHRDKAESARHVAQVMTAAATPLRRGPQKTRPGQIDKARRRTKTC
jgi:integrase